MKPNFLNITMRNGLVLGVLFSLNFIISTFNNPVLGLFSYLIVGLIVYLTYQYTARFRDRENGGLITFGQGFFFVFLLFMFASIISAGFKYVFLQFISPNYLKELLGVTMQTMETVMETVPDDMYDSLESFLTPINFVMATSWANIFISLIVGVIIGLVVKRSSFQNQN